MRQRRLLVSVLVCLAAARLVCATPAHAADADDKCVAAKLKAAGKACGCRHTVLAKALGDSQTPDFTECTADLGDAFTSAEDKAAGECPNSGESALVDSRLATLTDDVMTAINAAGAMSEDAVRCVVSKVKAAGKRCACVHKAQAKAATKGGQPDFTKCDEKLLSSFTKIEAKAAGACPGSGDAAPASAAIDAQFAEIEADISNLGTLDFARRGPYGVGVKTMTFVDTSRPTAANGTYTGAPERTLVTNIWYPTDPSLISQIPDAPLAEGPQAFPLLLRAHGFSGYRTDSQYLVQHFASHGYIVVSPDFPLSFLGAPGGPTLADIGEQALDLGFLIDTFEDANADPLSFFFGRVDTDTIGAIGHSLGGATVTLATFHTDVRDPRIDATVALSPLGCFILDGFFDDVATPFMIEGGTVDMITPYASNHVAPYNFANAEKYLVEMDGGTHLGFSDRLLFTATQNGDAEIGCSIFVGPDDPRPVTIDPNLPPDFLGGPANGIDPSGSQCEPICPLPPADFMLHARQNTLAKSASLAFFQSKLFGSVAGHRLITDKLDSENDDVALFYEE